MSSVRPRPIDRRRFLEIGGAASLSVALADLPAATARALTSNRPSAGASTPAPAALKPQALIYDERFEAARRLAVSVHSLRVPIHAIRGDVTELWYSQLYPLWKRAPVPIAGLTAYAAMFCLERLAWDHQLRMMRCAEGNAAYGCAVIAAGALAASSSGDGPLHFWLIAPPAQLAALTA